MGKVSNSSLIKNGKIKRNKSVDAVAIKVLPHTNEKLNELSDITGLKKYRVAEKAVDLLYEMEINKMKNSSKK